MRVTCHGVRGSTPTPQIDRLGWGGETTCFLVETPGARIVVDAGTGIRRLGDRLVQESPGSVLVLLTHFHLDHLMGLTAFAPLFVEGWHVGFASVAEPGGTEARLSSLLRHPYWPVSLEDARADVTFLDLPASAETGAGHPYRDVTIRWARTAHPQGSTAFRLEGRAGSVLIATDLEWSLEKKRGAPEPPVQILARTPEAAELLIFDGHFTDDEIPRYAGWGHSCPRDALELAQAAGIRRILLTHHAPQHTDAFLDEHDARLRPRGLRLAREGESLELAT